jgi:general secretion pathway protein J
VIAKQQVNGFTLIEILIAMTLLSMLVVLLFASLRIAAETWNAGEDKIIQINKKAVVYQFFKRQLANMRPINYPQTYAQIQAGAEPQPGFYGNLSDLRFIAALPLSAARKGLQVFQINMENTSNPRLMVSLRPYQTNQDIPAESVVLLDDVKSITFSYFGQISDNDNGGWHDEWSALGQLPQLIKVTIALQDNSFWPAMVFPIRVNSQVENNEQPTNLSQ